MVQFIVDKYKIKEEKVLVCNGYQESIFIMEIIIKIIEVGMELLNIIMNRFLLECGIRIIIMDLEKFSIKKV